MLVLNWADVHGHGDDNDDNDHDEEDGFKDRDYIGRAILWSDRATTVTACVFLDLECC